MLHVITSGYFPGSSFDVVYGASQSLMFSDLSLSRTLFKMLLKWGPLTAMIAGPARKTKREDLEVLHEFAQKFCFGHWETADQGDRIW